jgi:nucleotide-binding universal stress UspA family protein
MDTIVVGVDGSEQATRALRWAIDHAALTHARIVAVQAWSVPAMAYGGAGMVVAVDVEQYERAAERSLEESVAAVPGGIPAGVDVERRVVEGGAAGTLIDEARRQTAVLLVVGTRGHGGFTGLLLGSVSAALAHHAPCPLVIVPTVATAG